MTSGAIVEQLRLGLLLPGFCVAAEQSRLSCRKMVLP